MSCFVFEQPVFILSESEGLFVTKEPAKAT